MMKPSNVYKLVIAALYCGIPRALGSGLSSQDTTTNLRRSDSVERLRERRLLCFFDTQCGAGYTCENLQCKPVGSPPASGDCWLNQHCGDGLYCSGASLFTNIGTCASCPSNGCGSDLLPTTIPQLNHLSAQVSYGPIVAPQNGLKVGALAQMQSLQGGDPATVAITSLTENQIVMRLQEETTANPETNHVYEVVGFLAFSTYERGRNTIPDSSVDFFDAFHRESIKELNALRDVHNQIIGETGIIPVQAIDNGDIVEFYQTFNEPPVVVAQLLPQVAIGVLRITDVTTTSFRFSWVDWATGALLSLQPSDLMWMAVTPGIYEMNDEHLLQAQTIFSTNQLQTESFVKPFLGVPVVLSQSQTIAGLSPIVTRMRSITQGTFQLHLEEAELLDGTHNQETVGVLSFGPGTNSPSSSPTEAPTLSPTTSLPTGSPTWSPTITTSLCAEGYACAEDPNDPELMWVMKDDGSGNVNGPNCQQVCEDALEDNCGLYPTCPNDFPKPYLDVASFETNVALPLGFHCRTSGLCWEGVAPEDGMYLVSRTNSSDGSRACYLPDEANLECNTNPGNANCFGKRFATVCPCQRKPLNRACEWDCPPHNSALATWKNTSEGTSCLERINYWRRRACEEGWVECPAGGLPPMSECVACHACVSSEAEYDKENGTHASFRRCGENSQGEGGGATCAQVIDGFMSERAPDAEGVWRCEGHCGPVVASGCRTFSWGVFNNFYTLNWNACNVNACDGYCSNATQNACPAPEPHTCEDPFNNEEGNPNLSCPSN